MCMYSRLIGKELLLIVHTNAVNYRGIYDLIAARLSPLNI